MQNYLPLLQEGERVVLGITAATKGEADKLTISGIESLENGVTAYLEHRDGSGRLALADGAEIKMDGTQWVLVLERGTVGVASTLKAESLKLYPNPANAGGNITVALPAGVNTAKR